MLYRTPDSAEQRIHTEHLVFTEMCGFSAGRVSVFEFIAGIIAGMLAGTLAGKFFSDGNVCGDSCRKILSLTKILAGTLAVARHQVTVQSHSPQLLTVWRRRAGAERHVQTAGLLGLISQPDHARERAADRDAFGAKGFFVQRPGLRTIPRPLAWHPT